MTNEELGQLVDDIMASGTQKGRREFCAQLLAALEAARRAPTTFTTEPYNLDTVPDYAESGALLDQAVHHLNESLPNGQGERTQLAFAALLVGATQLGFWLEHRGLIPALGNQCDSPQDGRRYYAVTQGEAFPSGPVTMDAVKSYITPETDREELHRNAVAMAAGLPTRLPDDPVRDNTIQGDAA